MKPRCQPFWLLGSLSLFLVTICPLRAQIVQDVTLPTSSNVTKNGNTSVITGGTQAGSNLFHSFKEFSVPNGGEASFQQIDEGISNVISRVTGSSVSNINGLIEVLQANGTVSSANFFLLNPNGIIFGPNAKLNVGGSILASTASSLNFADGRSFSATNSHTPLLTVSVPIGLQFGRPTTSIQVQGAGLRVPLGKTLGLVGGDLTLVGGGLGAEGGRIELGSVTGVVTPDLETVQVGLTPIDKGWALDYQGVQNFQNIQLSQRATVTTSGSGGGDIQVQGRRVTLTDGSQMLANTQGAGLGGTLAMTASESVEISGSSTSGRPRLSGLFALVNLAATGNGGNLTIGTRRLTIRDGARVSTSTLGQGKAGNLLVQNATEVELVGGIMAESGFIPSGLFTQASAEATGAGGNLSISAGKLTALQGAQVNSTTFGMGRAGNLTVQATDVELVGAASTEGELFTSEFGLPFPSGLFAGTEVGSRGNGGTLTVKTDRLSLRDGAVLQTSTLSEGNAGNLIVEASESVELIGTKGSPYTTSLLAVSGGIPGLSGVPEATGRGGDLRIETGKLIVRDGATLAVSSLNPISDALGAGNLQVQAQTISLDNQGTLTAATESGDGGNITLQVQDLLLLRRNSNISTTAGTAQTGGNGGNITIDTPFVVAVPAENSDITANAFTGTGGSIQIKTQEILGIQFPEDQTPQSDITASSEFGVDGVVEINTPDVDPSRGLVNLPAELVDASALIASGCAAPARQGQGELIVTGRGGLPPSPSDTLSSDTVWSDLRTFTQQAEIPSAEEATQSTNPTTPQLVEAQGWVINDKGEVVLTAQASTIVPHSHWQTSASCSSY